MKRIQFIELEDFSWMPNAIRDGGTDVLDFFFAKINYYKDISPILSKTLAAVRSPRIVDLCSGGGGGTLQILKDCELMNKIEVIFSDISPNHGAMNRILALGLRNIRYHPESIDARNIPQQWSGTRTMSSALHHFPPEAVQSLLASIIKQRESLSFFDVAAPPLLKKLPALVLLPGFIINFFTLFLIPFLLVPFIRPFSLSRLVLTYLAPAIPILFAWDGVVSAMRAYTPEELLQLAQSSPGGETYHWQVGRGKMALYLVGIPKA